MDKKGIREFVEGLFYALENSDNPPASGQMTVYRSELDRLLTETPEDELYRLRYQLERSQGDVDHLERENKRLKDIATGLSYRAATDPAREILHDLSEFIKARIRTQSLYD